MSRQIRIDVQNYWYHVIARGQRREKLFYNKGDYERYLDDLNFALSRFKGKIGAFCLMPNHVHLLIYRGELPLSRIMQIAHTRYARYFNIANKKSGHVFQGRYKTKIILKDQYLAALIRYIHRNPVRAKIVKTVKEYSWSSDSYYRYEKPPAKIMINKVPDWCGSLSREKYIELVDKRERIIVPQFKDYIGEKGQECSLERRCSGRESGKYRERRGEGNISIRIRNIIKGKGVTLEELCRTSRSRKVSRIRQKLMVTLYRECYSPVDIARVLQKTPASVYRALERCD